MATRKSRLNTDSPTPSSGSESVPTTPTTLSTRTRGRKLKDAETPSALTIATDKPTDDDEETTVKSTQDEDEQMDEKELLAEVRKEASNETVASLRKRRLAALKDDSPAPEKGGEKPSATAPNTPATVDKTDKPAAASADSDDNLGMAKRPRRSVVENLLANRPPAAKLAKRRNSTGSKIEPAGQRLSSRIRKLKQMRNSKIMKKKKKPLLVKKPTANVSKPLKSSLLAEKPAAAAAAAKKVTKIVEKSVDSASDSELLKISRRRSDSMSKCSDATDTSSFQETKDTDDVNSTPDSQPVEVKEEIVAKDDEEKTTPTKDIKKEEIATVAAAAEGDAIETSEDKRPARRLRRNMFLPPPKTISTRSRSETPSKDTVAKCDGDAVDDEKEVTVKVEAPDSLDTPLHIETSPSKNANATAAAAPVSSGSGTCDDAPTDDKSDKSLSPSLVSEGVSEISVKQFYGRPDFLENNLGIEEDPKLGEIVQVKDKIKNGDSDKSTKVIDNNNAVVVDEAEAKADGKETADIVDTPTAVVKMEAKDITDYTKAVDENDDGAKNDSVTKADAAGDKAEVLDENVIVLSGEVEVRPKDAKKVAVKKSDDEADNVGEVVLFAITNGVRAKPEALETVLENQKRKNSLDEQLAENKIDVELPQKETVTDDIAESVSGSEAADDSKESLEDPAEETSIEAPTVETTVVTEAVADVDADTVPSADTSDAAMDVDDIQQPEAHESTDAVSEIDESSNGSADVNKENINTASENEESKTQDNTQSVKQSPRTVDSLRVTKQKESHLKTLGLLTHQEAVAVTIEKEKRREQRKSSAASSSSSTASNGKGKKNSEYTGTLKTVIKLHRGSASDKKKGRMPLKMTLSKSRGKNANGERDGSSAGNSEEDTYYTIHSEMDKDDSSHGAHSRKTHYRSHTNDGTGMAVDEEAASGKDTEAALVIPEKASSFRYHPGKLCQDQCFYCGGKFGLFDTPCHVAQIKSEERQKKILENEEKLTVDNCLCDACFRHVDRRANCPSYKKRLSAPVVMPAEPPSDDGVAQQNGATDATLFQLNKVPQTCKVVDCGELASHSVRRKWALKMRKTLCKSIQLNFEQAATSALLAICDKHYGDVKHMMVCTLCNRQLQRNHIYTINQESSKLEQLLSSQGIPVLIGPTPVVCKLCRYYVNLLKRPQDNTKEFVKNYRRRLLNFHNVEMVDDDGEDGDDDQDADDNDQHAHRSRSRSAKRARKSTPEISDDVQVIIRGQGMEDEPVGPLRSERQRLKKLQQEQEQQRKQQEHELEKQQQRGADKSHQNRHNTSSEDISLLRTNPNISMRELFPGEEEMGLNINVPFGSANTWRTPEGWTKVQTTIQYDDGTRRLWEELQKPYGNQSSFLRHLILLEKYFRNGDLVLSSSANSSAATYTESVQNRLHAYDNSVAGAKTSPLAQLLSNPATTITSVSMPRQLNSSVTILQATKSSLPASTSISKQPSASSGNATTTAEPTSLLKSNRTSSYTITTEPIHPTGHKSSAAAPKTTKTTIGSPPELISINSSNDSTKQQSSSQQMYVAQMQLTLQKQLQAQQQLQQQNTQIAAVSASASSATPKKTTGAANTAATATNQANADDVIRLPVTLTEAEMQDENWRPTLMPFSTSQKRAGTEQYQTADGRRLPGLVQVQSQNKPYVISIHDYNRLCILRRDKIFSQQQKGGQNASAPVATNTASVAASASIVTAQTLAAVSALTPASITVELERPKPASNAANLATGATILNIPQRKVHIPNKILEQNSLIPLPPQQKAATIDHTGNSDSLLRARKHPTSLLKSNVPKSGSSQISVTATNNLRIPNSLANALASTNAVSIISTPSISSFLGNTPTSTPPPQMQHQQPITITSVGSLVDGGNNVLHDLFRSSQMPQQQSVWQWAESLNKSGVLSAAGLDNSATSILKIPKSLTVIPQKRLSSKGDEM